MQQKDVAVKDLKIYAWPQLGDRCMVDVYNLYFGHIPVEGPFYRKPLASNPPKFSSQCIGHNKLAGLMKEMCQKTGLNGNFTNHSGKATCASRLFECNVDEQLIMQRQTGHRSSAVLSIQMAHGRAQHDSVENPAAPSSKKGKVLHDGELEPEIVNQVPPSLPSGSDTLKSTLGKKRVSMTFNFHFK